LFATEVQRLQLIDFPVNGVLRAISLAVLIFFNAVKQAFGDDVY